MTNPPRPVIVVHPTLPPPLSIYYDLLVESEEKEREIERERERERR